MDRDALNAICYPRGLANEADRIASAKTGLRWHATVDALAVSLLSDVQEMIELGRDDDARRRVNYVKWLITEGRQHLAPTLPMRPREGN